MKILLILFLIIIITINGMALTYTSQYPTQDDDHVKATTKFSTSYWQYFTTDPTEPLTGTWVNNQWVSGNGEFIEQRFHIDLGSAFIIRRIYYENGHNSGANTDRACKNFTFWGSNTGAGTFDDLVYANDEGWTQITTATTVFIEHVALDQADPYYITATNTTAYRYYAFKFADNIQGENYMSARRIELQTEDGYGEAEDNAIMFGFNF